MLSLLYLTLSEPETKQKEIESRDKRLEAAISRLANGDNSACAEIYEEARSSVYAFALSMVKNSQDAEDAMHDTFVAIFTHAQSYKPQGKPLAWILTVTRNFCLRSLKKNQRSVSREEDWERYEEESSDEAEQTEKRLIIHEMLKLLSDEERQIITLHAVSGLKHRQIAELLDIPLSRVLSKYNRAIKKLQNKTEGGNRA